MLYKNLGIDTTMIELELKHRLRLRVTFIEQSLYHSYSIIVKKNLTVRTPG